VLQVGFREMGCNSAGIHVDHEIFDFAEIVAGRILDVICANRAG
jgi:hypothetical protein